MLRRISSNNNWTPSPLFFVSVASKELIVYLSGLESTLAGISISVDSKGTYAAPKLCKMECFAPLSRLCSF